MKETIREARTVILDKNGKDLPVPEGTDPHVEKKKVRSLPAFGGAGGDQGSEDKKIGRKAEAQSLEEVKDA